MERKGVIAAGNMLVDHVHQIVQWPERGWLAEITRSERATGGAPLNVLLTLAKMHTGLPLQAVGLIGQDSDGDYIMAMLEQYHVNRQHVQRTTFAPTSMSQVMTDPSGQRTFFHSPGANRLLDLPAFEQLDTSMKIFHLGYLLLLDSLDMPDKEYGTRSARLLAQMRDNGFETSLDLVSRKGDPRYQPLVMPALRHLDYLVINELEPENLAGWRSASPTASYISRISLPPRANYWMQAYASGWLFTVRKVPGVKRRICRAPGSRRSTWRRRRSLAASGRVMRFAPDFCMAVMSAGR